jgi:hypothetical protein
MTSSAAARSGHLAMTAALTARVQMLPRAAAKLRGLIPRGIRIGPSCTTCAVPGPNGASGIQQFTRITAPPRAKSNWPP